VPIWITGDIYGHVSPAAVARQAMSTLGQALDR
jgi:hypothetical protein